MSFDILREFDTLYAQKPAQPPSTQSSSGFSFFDSLASTHANPQKPSASAFGDVFLPPQRPSSVQLPMQSAYRGIPQPMTRNKSNPLSDNAGSSFNDLVSLLDASTFVPLPVNSIQQQSASKPSTYNGAKRASLSGKDPSAVLAGSSGLKKSHTPLPPKPHSTFSWGRKSPVVPQQEEVEDFGDFAEASSSPVKTPTLPSRALQDSGNGFRRSLSISTHATTAPNYSAFMSYPLKTPSKEYLGLDPNSSNTSLSHFDTNASNTMAQQSNAPAVDDDFGDFIAGPTKSEFPTQYPNSNPPLVTNTIPPTPTSIPLGIIPLPTPVTTTTTIKKPTPTPILPPLSLILTAFPIIFSQPTTFLFSRLTQHPYPLRQRILSHPKTKDFLLGTCEAARVAGRIIAGRKPRTKRTKIGGSSGGSNHELQKEDREIAELVRIWKEECVGRLKAAMASPRSAPSSHAYSSSDPTAASSNPNVSRVPELGADLRAERVTGKGGSILDEEDRDCVLCGLYQNELVGKLYEHEFDMGGRWWVRGWGHRGCLRWWEEWEGRLVKKEKKR